MDHSMKKSAVADVIRELGQQLSKAGEPGEVAAQRLAAIGPLAVPVLIKVLRSGNRVAQENAARALGQIGAGAQTAVPTLTKAMQDGHPWVQKEAAEALAKIKKATALSVRADANRIDKPEPIVARDQQPTPKRVKSTPMGRHRIANRMPEGRKTYRNERHGFEIDIPTEWAPAPALGLAILGHLMGPTAPGGSKDTFQYGCANEAFNFVVGPLSPVPPLEDTELEFTLYAQNQGYTELEFGRIVAGDKQHVCARYRIHDRWGKRWNKKYMLVFGEMEYSITATCNDPVWFTRREKDWDAIVSSFRLLVPADDSPESTAQASNYLDRKREILQERLVRREITGTLYGRAYEAVAEQRYSDAQRRLEECLQENPDHVLAHKEMAIVLKKMGNLTGALGHRQEVKRLAPSDMVNRANLTNLLAELGREHDALQEAEELLTLEPHNPTFQALKESLVQHRVPKHQAYGGGLNSRMLGRPVDRMLFWLVVLSFVLLDCSVLGGWISPTSRRGMWEMVFLNLIPGYLVHKTGLAVGLAPKASTLLAVVLFLSFIAVLFSKGFLRI